MEYGEGRETGGGEEERKNGYKGKERKKGKVEEGERVETEKEKN